MHPGAQGEVLVRRNRGVVERHAVVGIGLNLALAVLGVHGDEAFIVDGADIAVVLLVGGGAVHHEGPGALGFFGGDGGDFGGQVACFLAAQGTDGEGCLLAHGQAGDGEFGAFAGADGCAAHIHLIAGSFLDFRPHQGDAAAACAGGAGEGRRAQGQHERLRPPGGIQLGRLALAVQLGGEGVIAGGGGREFDAVLVLFGDGAAGVQHIALAVQHVDDDLVAAVIADVRVHGGDHLAIADVLRINEHHGHLDRSPGAAGGLDRLQLA